MEEERQTANILLKPKAKDNQVGSPMQLWLKMAMPVIPPGRPGRRKDEAQEKKKLCTITNWLRLELLVDGTERTSIATSPALPTSMIVMHGSGTWLGVWDWNNYYLVCYQLNVIFVIMNIFSCYLINNYCFKCACYTIYFIIMGNSNLLFCWGLGCILGNPWFVLGFMGGVLQKNLLCYILFPNPLSHFRCCLLYL